MKKTAQDQGKSLKTLYIYAALVLLLICISLILKGFSIIAQSKYDGTHDFTFAVTDKKKVKEIISFHPQAPSVAVLAIQDNNIPYTTLAQDYGIGTEGYIDTNELNPIGMDVTTFMWQSILHTESWPSNLTIYDKIRLLFFSKGVTTNNKTVYTISLINEIPETPTILTTALTDQDIATENISIEVINATNISGFGQRLGRVLTNMGANVVNITTAQNIQKQTTISYYENNSYTAGKLEKILGVPATKFTNQTIADIVVTLGTNSQNTKEF